MSNATEAPASLPRDEPQDALWLLAATGIVCAILVAPLLVVEAPPLLDYLNHLARIAILADDGADPALARMYAPHWTIIPNLGLDILLTPLMHVLRPLVAGRIAAGVVLLLPVIGTIAYSRASYRRSSYWPLGAALVSYNATFLLGFMNFLAGIGFALLLAAAWIGWRDRRPAATTLLCGIGMASLFFCHLMGVILALLLVGAFELNAVLRAPGRVIPRALCAAPLLLAPGILYLLSPLQTLSTAPMRMPFAGKALQLLVPFVSYDMFVDLTTAAVVVSGVAALAFGGYLRINTYSAIALGALFALYVVSPFIAKGVYFVDTRVAIMLGYMVFDALMPTAVPSRVAGIIAMAFIGVFALRMATVIAVWFGYQTDLDGMRAVIDTVQPGQHVFVVSVAPEEAPDYWQQVPRSRMLWTGVRLDYHLAALLSLERHAFWPYLFADPTQQPIVTLPPYAALSDSAGSIDPHRRLDVATTPRLCAYDYVLLLNAGGEPDLQGYGAGRLSLVKANEVAALYRVTGQPVPACAHAD